MNGEHYLRVSIVWPCWLEDLAALVSSVIGHSLKTASKELPQGQLLGISTTEAWLACDMMWRAGCQPGFSQPLPRLPCAGAGRHSFKDWGVDVSRYIPEAPRKLTGSV